MQKKTDLFIFVGEQSADYYGSLLFQALKQAAPALNICGVGGPKMRSLGFECVLPMESFQLMSLTDFVVLQPKLRRRFDKLVNFILERAPKIVLLIDYPGGVYMFAQKLRKRGYKGKIIQYICPSLCFARQKDRRDMSETLDALFAIFPFELPLFKDSSFSVNFVGHPVLEKLKDHHYSDRFKQELSAPVLGIFPGSRSKLLKANFRSQLLAALALRKEVPSLCIKISVSNETSKKIIEPQVLGVPNLVLIPEQYTYDLMQACTLAVATCGTIALELALHEKPTVVTYGASFLDVLVAKYFSRWSFPHYCIVNVLGNDRVFPELIYKDCTAKKIYEELKTLYFSSEQRQQCINRCQEIQSALSAERVGRASEQVADLLIGLM